MDLDSSVDDSEEEVMDKISVVNLHSSTSSSSSQSSCNTCNNIGNTSVRSDINTTGEQKDEVDDDSSEGPLFTVERVVGKRKNPDNGEVQYRVKWEGYPTSDNTWEPENQLRCYHEIDEFERREAFRLDEIEKMTIQGQARIKSATSGSAQTSSLVFSESRKSAKRQQVKKRNGFEKGYKAEYIIGASNSKGKIFYLVKFINHKEPQLIPNFICKKECPAEIIAHFENQIVLLK